MTGQARPLDERRLRAVLADLYGLGACTLTPLDGEFDQNVRVDDPDGAGGPEGASVVKVVGRGGDGDRVALQVAALGRLAEAAPELPVPRVVATRTGAAWSDVEIDGASRRIWRLTWVDGRPLHATSPRRPELLRDLGRRLAELDRALTGLAHPLLDEPHAWDPARADWLPDAVATLAAGRDRERLAPISEAWPDLARRLASLPTGVIHGDANDHNVVVEPIADPRRITGLFDLGDMVRTRRVCEPAVAAAYAAFGCDDPVAAIAAVVAGYDDVAPLGDDELAVVVDLVRTRLAVSLLMAARRAGERPDDAYVTVSRAPARDLLDRLAGVGERWATARIRDACGRPPFETGPAVTAWLDRRAAAGGFHPILGRRLAPDEGVFLDLSVGSTLLGADPAHLETPALSDRIGTALARAGASVGLGRWNEARPIYLAPAFATGAHAIDEHRTIHLGIDLFVAPGTAVHAPLDGVVEDLGDNAAPKDYGPTILLRHEPDDVPPFWTLWGHLDPEVLERLHRGARLRRGDIVGRIGSPPRNGDWPPHLHLQLVLDPLGRGHHVPGVAPARERSTWAAWLPDPSVLCGLAPDGGRELQPSVAALRRRRASRLGTGLSLSYTRPLHLVRGWRQFLVDADGRTYLDLFNNVPHVGHSHPAVVEATHRQRALLDTNTRYLHEAILDYADALVARLPDPLRVVWVVNSASEANELAIRLARAATGRRELIVQEAAYHGHTTTLVAVSPYKFDGPGGEGRAEWVDVVAIPDDYRGRFRREHGAAGEKYGEEVARHVAAMAAAGRPPGAFLAETFPSVGGQIVPPDGYLERAYRAVRGVGGLCIADEVQTGFGRLGDAFWGFELQGVVPDVVVLGKPAGNGVPLGIVVATREVAEAFDTGMEFFSTFGGNPASCAAGRAVLDVIEAEGLQAAAARVGRRLIGGLAELARRWPVIGDVRGRGLFVGAECVRDPERRDPAPEVARYVTDRLRERGVLIGTDGPDHNVLKFRGPLVVDDRDVDRCLTELDEVLREPGARPTG